jgi:hypothetical protein
LAEVTPEQKALADKSLLSWRAFECSVLAEKAGKKAEQARLFQLGYDEGMAFLRALVDTGELTSDAVNSHAAIAFTWRLGGPTHDFRLGRVYEGAIEVVYDEVFAGKEPDLHQPEAWSEFHKRNCALLK